ncbi:MAG: hypothetical protein QG575_1558 [Euryarchaeota archaeon]|nr:hypothetical protein [Euryarchaeota archaeon]
MIIGDYLREIQSEDRTASQLALAPGSEWTHGITTYSNILFFNQVVFT